MRILRLQIHELGRHRDLDVALAPGFTIVRGPNESGKSTVQRALELALFRKPTATAAELDTLRTWGCAAGDHSHVRLEFIVEDEEPASGETITTRGSLEKEYKGAKGRVQLAFGEDRTNDPARADQVLAELTGIPTEAFFRSTASIRHHEMTDLDRDDGALRDRLQASIGSGERGSSRARRRLEEALRSLRAKGEKNPGRLKIAEETIAQAELSLRSGEAALAKLERDRDALVEARAVRSRVEAGFNESRSMLEAARQAEQLRADQAAVADRYERFRQAAEAQRRLIELEAIPQRSLSELRDSLDRLRTLQSRVGVLQETLREDVERPVEHDRRTPSYGRLALLAIVFFVVAAAAFASGGRSATSAVTYAGALLGVLGLVLAVFAIARYLAARDVRRRNLVHEHERALERQRRVGAEEGLRVASSGVATIVRDLGVPDAAAAEQLLADEQARRHEMATLQVQVNALLIGTTPEKIVEQRDQAALELEQKTAALAALGPIANDARARERLEAEVRERGQALERARDEEAAAFARVEANPVDAEQVAGAAERLTTWRDQLAALQRRARVYETTLAAIQAAELQTMRRATRFLEQHMGRGVERLTAGRYRRIRVDDSSLDIEVWSPEKSDWVNATQLSKGTVDQIYLAARIGLVRLVTAGRRPPLILDDPFVTFDDTRAARAALQLRELAHDFQVIYLTCSSRYDSLADAVVELPAPTELDVPDAALAVAE